MQVYAEKERGNGLIISKNTYRIMTLHDVARTGKITISPAHNVQAAMRLMEGEGLKGLVVVDDDRVLGVVHQADLTNVHLSHLVLDSPIRRPSSLLESMEVTSAWRILLKERAEIHPVVDSHGRLKGLISLDHLQKYISREDKDREPSFPDPGDQTILIVDDSIMVCKSLQRILKGAGYKTDIASSGKEALKKIKASPDLVLLDADMHRMSGYEILRKIRGDPSIQRIPVIILTTKVNLEDRIEAFADGADDYLQKPYCDGELLIKTGRLLKAKSLFTELCERNMEAGGYKAQLHELQKFNECIIENMGSGLVVMDIDGIVLKLNQAAVNILRIPLAFEALGRHIKNMNPLLEAFCHVKEPPSAGELRYVLPDGRQRSLGFFSTYLLGPGYERRGIIVIFNDLSERERAEEVLRNAAAEWRVTFDNMPDLVMCLDRNLRIVRANKALADALGLPFDKILGHTCYSLMHGPDALPESCLSYKAIKEGKGYTAEGTIEMMGRDFLVTATPIFDNSGSVYGAIHIMRDVTELKRIQHELRSKEKLAAIGEISGSIAHEIKNPFFAITSGIQVLQSKLKLSKDQKETLDIILHETMRVDRLIRQLLDLSTPQKMCPSSIHVMQLMEDVISLNQGLAVAKCMKITKVVPADMPPIPGDRDKLEQVMINLLQNAIEASERGGSIEISCGIDDRRHCATISIKDRGSGIPEEFREEVFRPFFSTKKGNTGMGLAISKKIVTNHRGDIRFEPRKGGGSIFIVDLPLRNGKPQ